MTKNFVEIQTKQKLMTQLITLPGNQSFTETVKRVISLIEEKKFNVFARIDHAKSAVGTGLSLNPTELIIFGNPEVGVLLMQDQQTCGIDLPVKILVWEDASKKVWLSYNTMSVLKMKHDLKDESQAVLEKIESVAAKICSEAAK